MAVWVTRTNTPHWVIYGGLHFLVGDSLLANRRSSEEDQSRNVMLCRVLLSCAVAIGIFHRHLGIVRFAEMLTVVCTLVAIGSYFSLALCIGDPRAKAQQLIFEFPLLAALILSFWVPITFEQISLVHFSFWFFLSLPRFSITHRLKFLGLHVAVFALLYLSQSAKDVVQIWPYASNFHITLALLLSSGVRLGRIGELRVRFGSLATRQVTGVSSL